MNNLTQNGLKCYLWGDLLLLQDLRCLHWSPWLKQCLVSNGEINQSSVSEPKCLLCEIRCVVWYRTGFGCADKADSHSYHACHIFKFSFSPFERIFLLKKSKKKKKIQSYITTLLSLCVSGFPPFLLWKCLTGFYEIWCKHVIAAIGEVCGERGWGCKGDKWPSNIFST